MQGPAPTGGPQAPGSLTPLGPPWAPSVSPWPSSVGPARCVGLDLLRSCARVWSPQMTWSQGCCPCRRRETEARTTCWAGDRVSLAHVAC